MLDTGIEPSTTDPSGSYLPYGHNHTGSPTFTLVEAWAGVEEYVTNTVVDSVTNACTSAEYSNLVAQVGSLGTAAKKHTGLLTGTVPMWGDDNDQHPFIVASSGQIYRYSAGDFRDSLGLGSLATMSYAPTAAVATNALGLAAWATAAGHLFVVSNLVVNGAVSNAVVYKTTNTDSTHKFLWYDDGSAYIGGLTKQISDVGAFFCKGSGAAFKIKTATTYGGSLVDRLTVHVNGWMRYNAIVTNDDHVVVSSNLTVLGTARIVIPTTTNGLVGGMLWNDGGTLKVTP
jgi:hypothetical protein